MTQPQDSPRKRIIVGIADMVVTNDASAELVTFSLGSCLGVTIHDPVQRVGGLLHAMMPDSSIHDSQSAKSPYMFVDKGLPLLIETASQFGANPANLVLKVAGGASVLEAGDYFKIGRRNFDALREILASRGFSVAASDVGGEVSRTMSLEVATGIVHITVPGHPSRIL